MNKNIESIKLIFHQWFDLMFTQIPKIVLSIALLVLFIFLAKIAKKLFLKAYNKSIRKHEDVGNILSTMIYSFLVFTGAFISLQIIGLEKLFSSVIAGAGIIGIIAGFALKDIASNFFAGIILKVQNPFDHGDYVEINDQNGYIIGIDWITTKVDTGAGQILNIPNQLILNTTFTNFSRYEKRRVVFESGVSYGDDLERVKAIALEEALKVEDIITDLPIDFYYTGIGPYAYNFQLRFWVSYERNKDYRRGLSDIIILVKKRFEIEGITIAFPITTIDFGIKAGVSVFDQAIQIKNIEDKKVAQE
ncbi:MAG TPA: mechanosensitive ion channel domain-containing protein [Chitinophagales bacterium]|nr:mechanosensitive ion channel domain-containing protein [Chitinophagales bacterium]